MDPIKVSVSTSQLKALLEADPKVYAQLESMACEKIGEEITRKLVRDSSSIHKAIEAKLKAEMQRYAYASSLPAAAKEAIAVAVNNVVRDTLASSVATFKADLSKIVLAEGQRLARATDDLIKQKTTLLNQSTQKALDDMMKTSADRFEKQARASFIDVIREAKGVVG